MATLRNELAALVAWTGQYENVAPDDFSCLQAGTEVSFDECCAKVRDAWALVAFSEISEAALRRYFNYHLRVICDIFDQLENQPDDCTCEVNALIGLTDHLDAYYGEYLDRSFVVHPVFARYRVVPLRQIYQRLMALLDQYAVNGRLGQCLKQWFSPYLSEPLPALTVSDIAYINLTLCSLLAVAADGNFPGLEDAITEKLLGLNFNYLGFLDYLQNGIQQQLSGLSPGSQYSLLLEHNAGIPQRSDKDGLSYDPHWPPVTVMFKNWLHEMAVSVQQQVKLEEARTDSVWQKIGLNLSVPQLACLVRLFFEEKIYSSDNLKEIFKLTARTFSSKQQEDISWGSLSQQYYSSSQVAAAAVRDMLLKMIARLNRHYFPVMAAISAAVFFH